MKQLSIIFLTIIGCMIAVVLCLLIFCAAGSFVKDLIYNDDDDYTFPLWLSITSYTIVSMAIGFWVAWALL